MTEYKKYIKNKPQDLTPWTPDFDMTRVSVSQADKDNGSPLPGDMIARNPNDAGDQWLVAKQFFEDNYELTE